jgi:guanyl-specific ribonuclease Sa
MTMRFKAIAATAIMLLLIAAGRLAAESATPVAGAATPAAAATTTMQAEAPAATAKLKPVKRRFLLSHSSSVYEQPDKTSTVIAHVRHGHYVSVTGVIGGWLQIRLPADKTGYIPSSAAE